MGAVGGVGMYVRTAAGCGLKDPDLDSGELEAVQQGDPQRAAIADLFHNGR